MFIFLTLHKLTTWVYTSLKLLTTNELYNLDKKVICSLGVAKM